MILFLFVQVLLGVTHDEDALEMLNDVLHDILRPDVGTLASLEHSSKIVLSSMFYDEPPKMCSRRAKSSKSPFPAPFRLPGTISYI